MTRFRRICAPSGRITLAKRYGGLLIIAAILVLAGVAGQQGWQAHQAKQADKSATQYLALTQAVDQPGASITPAQADSAAQQLQDFAQTAPEGYKTLASLRAAALYAQAQETDKAAALWNAHRRRRGRRPTLLRDVANLLWAQHALGIAPDADVLARLQPLEREQNPYHGLARETQALVYLHQGNKAMAQVPVPQVPDDPSGTEGVRNRAQACLPS